VLNSGTHRGFLLVPSQAVTGSDASATGTHVRGQSLSSMGESFFYPCTRHVSMYLRRGIVILLFFHSFILSHGVLFFLMSSGIPRTVHKCGGIALAYTMYVVCQFLLQQLSKKIAPVGCCTYMILRGDYGEALRMLLS
jgi:hypothetical protein